MKIKNILNNKNDNNKINIDTKETFKGKNIKLYKFDRFGYAQVILDLRRGKIDRINEIVSIGIIIGLFALGVLSKELLIIILCNTGIGKVTSLFVG